MTARSSLAAAATAAAILVSVAACGSSSATATPPASAASAAPASVAPASAAASSAVESQPPIEVPSNLASLLPGGNAPDAATLLTADMAASIIGGSPEKTTIPISIPNMSVAAYSNADGDEVTLFVEVIPGGLANAQLQAAIALSGAQGDLQLIAGIGDAAGKVVDDTNAAVGFVKGTNLVVVQATSGTTTGADLEPKVEAVARQIAGGL